VPVDHLVELGITIFVVVALRATRVVLVEVLVGLVDAVARQVKRHRIVLAVELRKPLGGVDGLEFAVDIDPLELVEEDDRRGAERGMSRVDTLTARRLSGP
jgi:hypothetical protein